MANRYLMTGLFSSGLSFLPFDSHAPDRSIASDVASDLRVFRRRDRLSHGSNSVTDT